MKVYLWLFFIFVIGASEAKELSLITRGLRYTALSSSLLAIASDGLVEVYYGKYKAADVPNECEKYRRRTQFCESTRDVCMWTAGLSLVGSIIAEKFTKNHESSQSFLNNFHLELCGKKSSMVSIYYDFFTCHSEHLCHSEPFICYSESFGKCYSESFLCHSEPFTCHSERSEESQHIVQGKLREESQILPQDKLREESR